MWIFPNSGGGGGGSSEPVIVNIPDTEYILVPEHNHIYCFNEITSLTISLPQEVLDGDVENFAVEIHFSSGEIPPELIYDSIKLKGDNVTIAGSGDGKYYLFEPQSNTRYDFGIDFDGEYVKGYISGTELIE